MLLSLYLAVLDDQSKEEQFIDAEERKEFSGLSVKVVKGHTVVSRAESNNEI